MKTLKATKFKRAAEKCGFSVGKPVYEQSEHHDGCFNIEMQQFTPAGEDWWVDFYVNNASEIKDKINNLIQNWDSDEEAEIWIDQRGKNGVPNSIRELLDDQDWKLEQLEALYNELNN